MNITLPVKILVMQILAAWWCAFTPAMSAAESKVPSLKVKMDVQGKEGEWDLVVSVKVDQGVTLYKANLPWGNRNTLILVAVAVNPGREELEQDFMDDNPGAARMTLEKNEEYAGRVPLKQHFKDLDKVLQHHDVILFWSYEMSLVNGKVLPKQGGQLLMKKNKE